MWAQELYIDEFDGGGDLALQQLSPGLNVVRVPTRAAEACLAQFIPTLLYGSLRGGAALRAGSMVVTQQGDSGAWEVLDLCRLPLENGMGLSELQVLAERGPTVDEDQLLDTLEAIDGPVYRAVFTDQLPVDDRLASWQASDWIVPLLRRQAPQATAVPGAAAVIADNLNVAEPVRSATLRQAKARWLRRQVQARSVSRPEQPSTRGDALSAEEGRATRDAYLSAKQACESQRQRIRDLSEQRHRDESEFVLLEQAISLQALWNQLRRLEAQLASPSPREVEASDIKQLWSLRRQIATSRAQLQRAQTRQREVARQQAETDEAECRRQQLAAHLNDWPLCLDHQRRHDDLGHQLARIQRATDAENTKQELLASQIRQDIGDIRRAGQALRAARHDVARFAHVSEPVTADASRRLESPPSTPLPDPRIESLRRQVQQMRDETRRLLQRQLLSGRALVGIGLLFSTGVAILLSALILNLDGAELQIGAIGLTCIAAAALLKSSFERSPNDQLRRQRLRITTLLAELHRVRAEPRQDLQSDSRQRDDVNTPTTDSAPTKDVLACQAANEYLANCQQDWDATLERLRLDPHLTPQVAVRQLRSRAAQPVSSGNLPARTKLIQELSEHRAQVDHWCRQAAQLLHEDGPDVAHRLPDEWCRRLQAEQHHLASRAAALEATSPEDDEVSHWQQHLTDLKRKRREILRRHGVRNETELKARLKHQRTRAAWETERQQLQCALQASLPADSAAGDRIRGWLQATDDLEAERTRQQQSLALTQRQISEAQEMLLQQQAVIARIAARPAHETTDETALNAAPLPQTRPHDEAIAIDLAGAVIASLASTETSPTTPPEPALEAIHEPTPPRQPPWLEWASLCLQQLTGDTCVIAWDDAATGPCIVRDDVAAIGYADLALEQRHTLVMALQMALVRCLGQRINHLPFVLTDDSFGVADETSLRIARALCELANAGQQVLVVTADANVTEQFRGLDVPTLVVTRQIHSETWRAAGSPVELHWQTDESSSPDSD